MRSADTGKLSHPPDASDCHPYHWISHGPAFTPSIENIKKTSQARALIFSYGRQRMLFQWLFSHFWGVLPRKIKYFAYNTRIIRIFTSVYDPELYAYGVCMYILCIIQGDRSKIGYFSERRRIPHVFPYIRLRRRIVRYDPTLLPIAEHCLQVACEALDSGGRHTRTTVTTRKGRQEVFGLQGLTEYTVLLNSGCGAKSSASSSAVGVRTADSGTAL
jgi:hypothetical protein